MSTKRNLYKLTTETYRECKKLQMLSIDNSPKTEKYLFQVIKKQDELKDKNKFYKNLLKHWEVKNENN